MNGNPTAAQKRFHDWCRGYGCMLSMAPNVSIHHIGGSKMKLKGCKKPGEWYVIPLSYFWHQDGDNKNARHINKSRFIEYCGRTEKELWLKLISEYESQNFEKPMSEEDYIIIAGRA